MFLHTVTVKIKLTYELPEMYIYGLFDFIKSHLQEKQETAYSTRQMILQWLIQKYKGLYN